MSPHLFLIAMEGLTAMLSYRISLGDFAYNPKCQALNISHCIFADDLFLLCGADIHSFQLIQGLLNPFHQCSVLQPNLNKSSVKFAGVDSSTKLQLQSILAIPEGHLPIKYLGVPLISSRLQTADCQVLIDKLLAEFKLGIINCFLTGGEPS